MFYSRFGNKIKNFGTFSMTGRQRDLKRQIETPVCLNDFFSVWTLLKVSAVGYRSSWEIKSRDLFFQFQFQVLVCDIIQVWVLHLVLILDGNSDTCAHF